MPASKRPPKPRRPGRPPAGANLRGRLLDAAIARFAERGIAATTLRAIATAAGVTPALLHYYFNSKNSLVETMLGERIAPFVAISVAPLLTPLPSPRATLRKFLETHMRNLAGHPWMPRLMVREVLSEGGSLREHMQAQFSAVLSPKVFMLIVAAQQRDEIRTDLNPMLIGLSLISLAVFPFAAAPLWREVSKSMVRGAPDYEARIEHLQRMAAKSPAWERPEAEALIGHTLALFDSALEKPHAKSRR
ncbi:MAG: helix-turn-helix domain containing protein [Rudaea sp.]|nr:helix-turn-helix domain containing protein [Rudaea sp.]